MNIDPKYYVLIERKDFYSLSEPRFFYAESENHENSISKIPNLPYATFNSKYFYEIN